MKHRLGQCLCEDCKAKIRAEIVRCQKILDGCWKNKVWNDAVWSRKETLKELLGVAGETE